MKRNGQDGIRIGVATCCIGDVPIESVTAFYTLLDSPYVSGYVITTSSLLPKARNIALQQLFRQNVDFTHVFFVDWDMCGYNANHLGQLLSRDKDIISATCNLVKPPYSMAGSFSPEQRTQLSKEFHKPLKEREPVECMAAGTAFLLIRREVLDTLEEKVPGESVWFNTDRMQRGSILQEAEELVDLFLEKFPTFTPAQKRDACLDLIEFGTDAHKGSPLIGEDINFCHQARRHDFSCWVDPAVIVHHMGQRAISAFDMFKYAKKDKPIRTIAPAENEYVPEV